MRKHFNYFILLILLQSSLNLFSQNQITGMGGFTLGESFLDTYSVATRENYKVESEDSHFFIRDFSFLNHKWSSLELVFNDNKLVKCGLRYFETKDLSPGETKEDNNVLNSVTSLFNEITRKFYLKYSSPAFSFPFDNTWIDSSGNSIHLTKTVKYDNGIAYPEQIYIYTWLEISYTSSLIKEEDY